MRERPTPAVGALRHLPSRLDFIIDPRVRLACEHWRSLLRDASPPDRRTLDPGEMKAALPHLWICEEQAEGQFYFRLTGEEVNRLFGESLRHRPIERVFAEPVLAEVVEKLSRVLDERCLVWSLGPLFAAFPQGPAGECAVMPIAIGGSGRAVLGVSVSHAAIPEPPRRLYPIWQRREIVPLVDLAPI